MTIALRWLTYWPKSIVFCLAINVHISSISADEPKLSVRPISEADSVLAVHYADWGRASSGEPAIIFAAWPDGYVIWSDDRLKGGAPYRAGRVEPKRVAALLERFDKDGIFADGALNDARIGVDSHFLTVFIKSDKKQVKMLSSHELYEDSGQAVDHAGPVFGDDRPRWKVLREASAEYLFFRLVWSDTRDKLSALIPANGKVSAGKPLMKAGVLSWQEPAAVPSSEK